MPKQQAGHQVQITNGPSKYDFVISSAAGNMQKNLDVQFTIDLNGQTVILIMALNGFDKEDGSGVRFNFRGYVRAPDTLLKEKRVEGYYDTGRRKGHLFLELA